MPFTAGATAQLSQYSSKYKHGQIHRSCEFPLRPFLRQSELSSGFDITLSQPLARFDELDNVENLLECHDGRRDTCQNPRPEAIHFVGAGHFHSIGTSRRYEKGQSRMTGAARLNRCPRFIVDRQQRW